MKKNFLRSVCAQQLTRHMITIACALLLGPGNAPLSARQAQQPTEASVRIPADQLDALVAPIALYPDAMLSQTLVASTYPLEIMQLQQWLERNKGLDEKTMADTVKKQPWDPSIQAMAALPDAVKRLADDIQWTTDLGNAFLAQQSDVMEAIQRMRVKAQGTGALTSNEHQSVESQVVDGQTVVVVEQANPEVVYVPSYNPEAVYGPPVYPYPSIYYPPYSGVLAASALSFGAGVAMGAMFDGGWGWGMGWGDADIDLNVNNSFNRNANVAAARSRTGRNTWQHNPQHRGGAPYSDRATANRFGSNARGESPASRQQGARQQIARQKGNLGSVGQRGGVGERRGTGTAGGTGARSGISGRGGVSDRSATRGGGGGGAGRSLSGGDRIGNRSLGSSSSFGNRSGFGGGSGGFSGGSARSSSSRGSSSVRGRSGGGFGGGGGWSPIWWGWWSEEVTNHESHNKYEIISLQS